MLFIPEWIVLNLCPSPVYSELVLRVFLVALANQIYEKSVKLFD